MRRNYYYYYYYYIQGVRSLLTNSSLSLPEASLKVILSFLVSAVCNIFQ